MFLSNQVSRDAAAELWLADIQEAVKEANRESQKTLKCEAAKDFPAKRSIRSTNRCKLCVIVCSFSVSGCGGSESGCKGEQSQSDSACSDSARDSAAGHRLCMCCRLSKGTLQSDHSQDPHRCITHKFSLLHPVKNVLF